MPLSISDRARDLLLQSVLIIFSVLLALFIDEIRSDYKVRSQRNQVVGNLVEELRGNRESLSSVMPNHEAAAEGIGTYLDSVEAVGGQIRDPALRLLPEMLSGQAEPPSTQRTAWESARLSDSYGLIPYETTYRLARLYDLQASGVETTWGGVAQTFLGWTSTRPSPRWPC